MNSASSHWTDRMLLIHTAILLLSSVLSVTAECTTGNSSCGIYTNPPDCPAIKAFACNDSEIVTPCEEMGPPPEGRLCCQDLCKRGGFYDASSVKASKRCQSTGQASICVVRFESLEPRTCDTKDCLLDEECCYDDCGVPICVKIPDPIGAGVYPNCSEPTPSVTQSKEICRRLRTSKTCEETGCSITESCCVNRCAPLGCMEKFGYCPSYNPRIQCRLANPTRCDVTACSPGTKCCIGDCEMSKCINESIPTISCTPTWTACRETCGTNAYCNFRQGNCDTPQCVCYDPYVDEPQVPCANPGPGCGGHPCASDEVCCTSECDEPQCVKRY